MKHLEHLPIRLRANFARTYAEADRLGLHSPGIIKRAVSFAGAATRHVLHGLPMVSGEEKERRLGICRQCEFFIAETERCRKCGCAMRTKASWKLERCPVRKW